MTGHFDDEASSRWVDDREQIKAAKEALLAAREAQLPDGFTIVYKGLDGISLPIYDLRGPCGCEWLLDGSALMRVAGPCITRPRHPKHVQPPTITTTPKEPRNG